MIKGVSFSKLQAVIAAIVVAGCLAAAWIYTRRQLRHAVVTPLSLHSGHDEPARQADALDRKRSEQRFQIYVSHDCFEGSLAVRAEIVIVRIRPNAVRKASRPT